LKMLPESIIGTSIRNINAKNGANNNTEILDL